jgi:hypothetical protein
MTLNPTVTGRDDLTNARFQIATDAGPRTVKGCVYREFGLHPEKRRVVLTHLPTGNRLGAFDDMRAAYAAMSDACRRGFGRA